MRCNMGDPLAIVRDHRHDGRLERRICRSQVAPGPAGPRHILGPVETIGPMELLIILAVVVLLFGGAKIPQLARSLGRAQKEFKEGLHEGATSDDGEHDQPPVA